MELFSFSIVLTLITSTSCVNHKLFGNSDFESVKSISTAIKDVIQKFYIENKINFDFIIYGNSSKHISALADEVIKNVGLNTKTSYTKTSLIKITDIENWNHELSQSAIIFVKTIENLIHLQKNTSDLEIYKDQPSKLINTKIEDFKFLVYIEEMQTIEELMNILEKFRVPKKLRESEMRFFEYFITHDENFVNLSANLLFSEDNCYHFTPTVLNTFDIKSQKWYKNLENFDHFSNFNECMLSFDVIRSYLWYHTQINEHEFEYNGLLYELLKITSEILNFTTHYICYDPFERKVVHRQVKPKNHLIDRVQISFGFTKNSYYLFCTPYKNVIFYFLVTKNDLYTNYEKLFFPFDDTTWIYLSITFALTFVIIFILQRCPQWIKIIFFGTGVRSPAYNVINILFGFSQRQIPRENFSRIILLLFIWFCLMFRNCYQSMIFDFMTTDMRKPMPQSFEDLYKMNYTIICLDHSTYIYMNKKLINDRESPQIINLRWNDFQLIYQNAVNEVSNQKLAFFVDDEGMHAILNFTTKNTLPALHNEKTLKPLTIIIQKNYILHKTLTPLIVRFFETGITNHFVDYGSWYLHRPFENEIEDTKRILSLKDLEYGFVIWIIACFVSLKVFLWEIRKKVCQIILEFTGLIGFLIVLKMKLSKF
ncbi:hypothetical protein PVAND_016822 [Polypedilum vanderplanki]|uniref:Ionotropic receptor n=1 Tax=Polypedilum vanderplanki TaxID=319348 RepID=A0A9J6BGJ0_POLVA|nr:hypothetical protein PVAND_016822 [Polypedilum vanderplanki]